MRIVIGTGDVAIIEDIGGNAIAPNHGDPGANQQTVPANLRTINRKVCARAARETGNDLVRHRSVFVLPGRAELRYERDITHFPLIRGFCAKSRGL